MKDYNKLLRAARERAGITRVKLAELIGEDTRHVVDHELNGRIPLLGYCVKVADALQISLDELFGREHKPLWVVTTPCDWRETYGLTKAELAQKAGISVGALRGVEQKQHDPMIITVECAADALGLGIDEYIGHLTRK